jgi:propanediol dehydratase small subunit
MAIDPNIDLRAMVREVLREAIAQRGTSPAAQSVTIRNDADLQAFIAQLAAPGAIEAVRSGALKFTLAAVSPTVSAAAPGTASVTLDGVVSERKLQTIASGTTIRLAATAVLTPMAKDAARRLGLKFERNAP